MKAIVTGGAGFVGSHIARALQEAGHNVHVIDNYVAGRFPDRVVEGVTYHEGSILDAELLEKVFDGADWIFHTAALPRVQYSIQFPKKTDETNIGGTVAVLDAAQKAGVTRVIYSASSSAYGNQDILPLVETMPGKPMSPYALQKHVGEEYCRLFSELHGLETVSLRYFNVYGPHADPQGAYALVIAKFIEQRKKGEPLTIAGTGKHTRDYTHVSDIVRANLLAAQSNRVGKGEVINIGGGKQWSVLQVAEMVGGAITAAPERVEPVATEADIRKAKELLDWEPKIRFEEGVAELKHLAGIL